jgi:hypothetical protein
MDLSEVINVNSCIHDPANLKNGNLIKQIMGLIGVGGSLGRTNQFASRHPEMQNPGAEL